MITREKNGDAAYPVNFGTKVCDSQDDFWSEVVRSASKSVIPNFIKDLGAAQARGEVLLLQVVSSQETDLREPEIGQLDVPA